MQTGRAPIGYDDEAVELHHLTQTEVNGMTNTRGTLAEVGGEFHSRYGKTLHMPKPAVPKYSSFRSNIDGTISQQGREFDAYRQQYWRKRAEDFK
jgi:filamentous hemagglutinin